MCIYIEDALRGRTTARPPLVNGHGLGSRPSCLAIADKTSLAYLRTWQGLSKSLEKNCAKALGLSWASLGQIPASFLPESVLDPCQTVYKRYRGHPPTRRNWDAMVAGARGKQVTKATKMRGVGAPQCLQNCSRLGPRWLQNGSKEALAASGRPLAALGGAQEAQVRFLMILEPIWGPF